MRYSLNDSLQFVKGVGPKIFSLLKEYHFETIKDILFYFPFRYDDLTQVKKIKNLKLNESGVLIGKLTDVRVILIGGRKLLMVTGLLTDESGSVKVIWFGQKYILNFKNKEIVVVGKLIKNKFGFHFSPSQTYLREKFSDSFLRILPVYRALGRLNSQFLRKIIFEILNNLKWQEIKDPLPPFILQDYQLLNLKDALAKIHFPLNNDDIYLSRQRFIFQDLLIFNLKVLKEEKLLLEKKAPKIKVEEIKNKEILDFVLTYDQKNAWEEIKNDISQEKPMNRLLQGDVGTGKTILAQLTSWHVVLNGYQVVMMAPTEILARQHFLNFLERFKNTKVNFAFVSAKENLFGFNGHFVKTSKKKIQENIFWGRINIVIGTHSVISEKIKFYKVGLVIVDEQQRFGVEQRAKLIEKSQHPEIFPHFLSLTATPIPRTLALVFYGKTDISLLKQRPYPFLVKTFILSSKSREKVYKFVEKKLEQGSQMVVICPRVEETEKEVKTVKGEFKKIKERFSKFKVDLLYGKLKPQQKEKVIKEMINNEIQILVTSSILEVGVNFPQLNLMIIEEAERFGLAQLYQMIGRLSRFGKESYAFLFVEKLSKKSYLRLKAIKEKKNAFELAEIDLRLRGPGEFFGKEQSGLPDIVIEGLKNTELLMKTRKAAQQILEKSPDLSLWPELLKIYEEKGKILSS